MWYDPTGAFTPSSSLSLSPLPVSLFTLNVSPLHLTRHSTIHSTSLSPSLSLSRSCTSPHRGGWISLSSLVRSLLRAFAYHFFSTTTTTSTPFTPLRLFFPRVRHVCIIPAMVGVTLFFLSLFPYTYCPYNILVRAAPIYPLLFFSQVWKEKRRKKKLNETRPNPVLSNAQRRVDRALKKINQWDSGKNCERYPCRACRCGIYIFLRRNLRLWLMFFCVYKITFFLYY